MNGADRGSNRFRAVFVGSAAMVLVLLGVFAYSLAHAQQQQRRDLEKRFQDRADVSAAMTDAIFGYASAQGQIQDATKFGGATVDPAQLTRRARQSQAVYVQILASDGRVLASTPGAPRRSGTPPYVTKALRSGRIELSNMLRGPGGAAIVESASAFRTAHGTRVELSASKGESLSQFLGGFLSKIPNVAGATSYVIDANGKVVGSPKDGPRPGSPIPDRELAVAATKSRGGSYDGDRYFAAAPIGGSPWRVALATSKSRLYASVNGSQRVIPWIIFIAFALVAVLGLVLFRRVLIATTALQRAELSRLHALEINDNVVQRLVLAKYALDRGSPDTSREKLAETLRETQQLVTSLLEGKEIVPGTLRRSAAAPTDRPPEPEPVGPAKVGRD